MKYIFLAALLYILYLLGRNFLRQKLRGEPQPQRSGPRSMTLLAVAIMLVYGVMLAIRLTNS